MSLSLTEQLFDKAVEERPKSLTEQLFDKETAPAPIEETLVESPKLFSVPDIWKEETDIALNRSTAEYNRMKTNPILTAQFKDEVVDTLSGIGKLAAQPYEVVRGAADFVLSLPGFGLGLINAGQRMATRMMGPFNMEDLYNAASEGMAEGSTWWHEHVNEPLVEPTPESQLVGQVAMAPAMLTSAVGGKLAESEYFKDYPNLRGILKFTADIGGLILLGKLYKGSKKDVVAKSEEIVNKVSRIAEKEEIIKSTSMDEAFKEAQRKVLEVEKQQLELEAQEIQKNLNYGKMIKEDLGESAKKIKVAKTGVTKTQVKRLTKKKTLEEQFEEEKLWPEDKTKTKTKTKEKEPEVVEPPEETTDLDLQTGAKTPEGLTIDNHPLSNSLEKTKANYEDFFKYVTEEEMKTDPLTALGKLVNDVNRWRHGEEGIDIETVRNRISEIAVNSSKLKKLCETAEETELFDFLAKDAGEWARRTDRLAIERTGEVDRTKLFEEPEDELVLSARDKHDRYRAISLMVSTSGGGTPMPVLTAHKNLFTEAEFRRLSDYLKGQGAKEIEVGNASVEKVAKGAGISDLISFDKVEVGAKEAGEALTPRTPTDIPYKGDIVSEAHKLFDVLDLDPKYKRMKKFRVVEQVVEPGEPVDIPATWHDAVFRYTAVKLPDGTIHEGRAGSYDTIIMEGHVAAAKKGSIPPDSTLYVLDLGAEGTTVQTRTLRIYRAKSETGRLGRAEPKLIEEPSTVQLNMMIPVDKLPEAVISVAKGIKGLINEKGNVLAKDIFRNKELWKKTGFWLGKDFKWRYEIDDRKMKIKMKMNKYVHNLTKRDVPLYEIIDYPELFKAFPQFRYRKITLNNVDYPSESYGAYTPVAKKIRLDYFNEADLKSGLNHEIQHMVAEETGSFQGASPRISEQEVYIKIAEEILKSSKDEAIRKEASDLLSEVKSRGVVIETDINIIKKAARDKGDVDTVELITKMLDQVDEKAYVKYMEVPGEMEARLNYYRERTRAIEKGIPPWESLEKLLTEERANKPWNATLNYRSADVSPAAGQKLYSIGGATAEGAKQIVADIKRLQKYVDDARAIKSFKPKEAFKLFRKEFVRNFVDRSGNIRKEMLDKLGDTGYSILQKMYLAKGSNSLATMKLEQMRKEVYSGFTSKEKSVLDAYIRYSRLLDIAKYKTTKQFVWPKGITPRAAAEYVSAFEHVLDINPERAAIIRSRAEAYFDWMKVPLKDMLDAELISQTEYDALASHRYEKIKLAEIYDKRYEMKVGAKKRTVYDSGIESLARGRDTDVYEPSSEVMALEVFNRAYGRVLNNKANKSLLDLARKDSKNPFVRVKEKREDRIPTGWNRIFMFEEGERKAIYISPEMSKEWIISNPDMSYGLSKLVRYVSGSPVLRTFATGINWGFALANMPRDIMHTWFTARVFEDGKWENVYSPQAPVFAAQIGRDLASVFTDVVTRGERYKKYIEEGGGMEFLVHQGRIFQRGRHLEGPLDKVNNFLGYFGETSELLPRIGIRERVIRRKAKEKGISLEEARKDKSITSEATFTARDYMDFGQGGGIAKAVDNGIPYLNAAIQGTRGLWRSFAQNPVTSTYKLAQFAAAVTGLYIANKSINPKTMESLRGNVDVDNNLVIPLGDQFGFEDEHGQTRYPYLKIPLDPGMKFFKTFFEASTDKWLGYDMDVDSVVDSLKEQSPVGVTELPPAISALVGYSTNKDFWLNEDIWRRTEKPFSYPESKEEYIPGNTPQAYVDWGELTGMSPERTRYAVEELVTSGTVWSYLAGKGYEVAFGDLSKEQKEQHLAMALAKTPVVKRFFGTTHPYSKYAKQIEDVEEDVAVDRWIQRRELDRLTEGYLYAGSVERNEVMKYIRDFKDKETQNRLLKRFDFANVIKGLPNRSFWMRMKGLIPEARAKVFVEEFYGKSIEEQEEIRAKEIPKVDAAGGVFTSDFWDEVTRLRVSQ